MKRNDKRSQAGYSLLEVLLALVLAGTATAVIAFSYQQSAHLQKSLEGRVTAAVLGAGKLAELEKGSELLNSGTFSSPYQQYRWISREEPTESGREMIILTIQWGGENRNYQKEYRGFRRTK